MPIIEQPAALITTRVVPARLVERFHGWADALDQSALSAAGHVASIRLEQGGGLFHLVHQFDSPAARDAWTASSGFDRLQNEAAAFPVERRQAVDGRLARLIVPSESAASRSRTFIATWIAVFPVLLVLSTVVRAVAGDSPQPIQLLFSSLMLTGLLQFVIMPRVQRIVRPWALAGKDGRARAEAA